MIIYRAENKVNGKVYIGQTLHDKPDLRLNHHFVSRWIFGRALRKYGKQSFIVTIVDHATTQDELDRKERKWIQKENCIAPHGYNLTTGGEGGYKRHRSTIRKLKASMRKHWDNPDYRKKISERLKGHVTSEETREKIRLSLTGRPSPKKGKPSGQRPWNTGLTMSDPRVARTITNMAKANVGRTDTREHMRRFVARSDYVNPMAGKKLPYMVERNRSQKQREAVSKALKGRIFSPETIAKMQAAQQARWARVRAAQA